MVNGSQKQSNPVVDTVEVVSSELLARVKGIIKAGNARRLVIRKPNGESLIEIPLTVGAAGGLVLIYQAPVLAAVASIGLLFTKVRLDIVRKADYSG